MNNKGINLIALVIMIIIMIILAAIAIKNSIDAQNKSLVARAYEENRNVVDAIQNRYGEYMTNPTTNPLVGETIPSEYTTIDEMKGYIVDYLLSHGRLQLQDQEALEDRKAEIEKLLQDNKDYLKYTRILEHSHLSELGLESMPLNCSYVVNYFGTNVIGPIY